MGSHAAGRPPRAKSVGGFRAGSTGDAAAAGRKQRFARAFWPITAVRQGVRHARSRSADIGPAPRETRRRWGKTAVRTSVLAKNSGSAGRPPRAKSVGDIGPAPRETRRRWAKTAVRTRVSVQKQRFRRAAASAKSVGGYRLVPLGLARTPRDISRPSENGSTLVTWARQGNHEIR
jgi:hypothetical protein